jgi:hypothetical protein
MFKRFSQKKKQEDNSAELNTASGEEVVRQNTPIENALFLHIQKWRPELLERLQNEESIK